VVWVNQNMLISTRPTFLSISNGDMQEPRKPEPWDDSTAGSVPSARTRLARYT
jgi:hypothetical protein